MHKRTLRLRKIMAAVLSALLIVEGSAAWGFPVQAAEAERGGTQLESREAVVSHSDRKLSEYLPGVPSVGTAASPAETMIWDEDREQVDLPRYYSSREQGFTPAVRDQGYYNTCWAHAGTACMEIGMIKHGMHQKYANSAEEFALSVAHGLYYSFRPVADAFGFTSEDVEVNKNKGVPVETMVNKGSSPLSIGSAVLTWQGPVLEKDFPTVTGLYSAEEDALNNREKAYENSVAIVTEVIEYDEKDYEEIKKAILKHGAVSTGYKSGGSSYSSRYYSHYSPASGDTNHAVTVVGWDDDFPKENFVTEAPEDGAWLIRDSRGANQKDEGYFWLSYHDATMDGAISFQVEEKDKYDNLYTYYMPQTGGSASWVNASMGVSLDVANVFPIQNERELIKAVQFPLFLNNYEYSIMLYKNPEEGNPASGEELLEQPITGRRRMKGRFKVDLEQPVWVEADDKIAVCVTLRAIPVEGAPNLGVYVETDSQRVSHKGESYYRKNNEAWIDCSTEGNGSFSISLLTDTGDPSVPVHEHDWAETWSYNGDYHWHECTGDGTCDAHLSEPFRGYEKHHGGTANCQSRAKCDDCGQEYGIFSSRNHIGDGVCKICGETISPKDRQRVKNLKYDFTGMNDEIVSSTVGDKPRLLIFFSAGCGYSKQTMTNLVAEQLQGVDIVAVDIGLNSKEEVQEFMDDRASYPGTKDITFCYEGRDNNLIRYDYSNHYKKTFPDAADSPLPIMYYIDTNDDIRYMTTGVKTLADIKENLETYCWDSGNEPLIGLNLENPRSDTFTTIDGDTVSATAENGRPKVIVFGITTNNNVADTLRSFSEDYPEGADIYFVDFWGMPQEEVRSFKDGIPGSEDITYCFGGDLGAVVEYMEKGGISLNGYQMPITVYIDGNNRLQYVDDGKSTSEKMWSILKDCCSYGEEEVPEVVTLKGVTITKAPSKTEYEEGESFDPAGMEVTAAYSDDSTKTVDSYTVEPSGALAADVTEVTIRYTEGGVEKTTTQKITVNKKETPKPEVVLEGISITKAPTKTEYQEGEKFDSAGMEVTAAYSDDSTKTVDSYTVEPSGILAADVTEVTIRYTEGGVEKTTTQKITVNKKETPKPEVVLEGISITKAPTKTEYQEGEKFDSAGMEVTAAYSDDSTKAVDSYTVEPSGALAADVTEVTIRYTEGGVEKTTTQKITVNK
ncbi:MAG: bacterial Ig-like domain-containing protein, partial [Lachnospiraceae bacterium]|nr:bacterial Ig-like domain-containing protein [Lachnospiraceae bacterium]